MANASQHQMARVAWGYPFVSGVILAVLGLFAAAYATPTGLISIVAIGLILIIAGFSEIGFAIWTRKERPVLLPVLSGIFSIVVGGLLLARPAVGLAAASFLLAAYFFGSGLFRGITSVVDRYDQWGWDFVYGLSAVALGVIILASWPVSSLWIVGLFIGIELFLRGIALMAVSLTIRHGVQRLLPTRP